MNPAEDYILNQPEPFGSMLFHLKGLIERTVPDIEMKSKWGVPCFYSKKHPICYLNASKKGGYVDVAFWNAAHLTRHTELMFTKNRKVIKSMRYTSLEEIDDLVLTEILQEAHSLKEKGFYKREP